MAVGSRGEGVLSDGIQVSDYYSQWWDLSKWGRMADCHVWETRMCWLWDASGDLEVNVVKQAGYVDLGLGGEGCGLGEWGYRWWMPAAVFLASSHWGRDRRFQGRKEGHTAGIENMRRAFLIGTTSHLGKVHSPQPEPRARNKQSSLLKSYECVPKVNYAISGTLCSAFFLLKFQSEFKKLILHLRQQGMCFSPEMTKWGIYTNEQHVKGLDKVFLGDW